MLLQRTPHHSVRLSLLALLALLLALMVALPASAEAKKAKKQPKRVAPIVGVGDNNWPMFSDPNHQALNTKISRLIIPYDFYRDPVELHRTTLWLEGARNHGIEPLVSLQRSEKYPTKLPSVSEFSESIKFLLANYPWVNSISPWNEANHKSQPTVKNPRRAAEYYNVTRLLCSNCKIVAADVLDQTNLTKWLKTFKRYARKPQIWGLHAYTDANQNKKWSKSQTKKFLKSTKGEVWMTEVGGIVAFDRRYPFVPDKAASALRRTLDMGFKDKRISRIYLYCWYGTLLDASSGPPFRWDSGIVGPDGLPRAGYTVLKDWLAANPAATRKP